MKYFTPDLLVRGQSEDPRIADEVERLWDEAILRYQSHLDRLRPTFPAGLQALEEHPLHDSLVRIVSKREHELLIVVQMETANHEMLHLRFDLAEPPVIHTETLPEHLRSEDGTALWLYEEVEQAEVCWRMCILLSNGWEMEICFHDVAVDAFQALWPSANVAVSAPPH
ncbi:MAG: hypothetical protein K2X38_16580 [Gemmataceae bacterium]|nr:hypothetical protein [Gemmataceae bacterium]